MRMEMANVWMFRIVWRLPWIVQKFVYCDESYCFPAFIHAEPLAGYMALQQNVSIKPFALEYPE